jgi:hypothetical protein
MARHRDFPTVERYVKTIQTKHMADGEVGDNVAFGFCVSLTVNDIVADSLM